MWKRSVSMLMLAALRRSLLRSDDAFHRLLGTAYDLQRGKFEPELFRQKLDEFYRTVSVDELKTSIDFSRQRQDLLRPGGYKVDVLNWQSRDRSPRGPMRHLWNRYFTFLRHLGVRCDTLILRAGEQIPPHAHQRVISGFLVLEGLVACQHFDRIQNERNSLLVHKTVDANHGPGAFSTNSEFHDNIHWLAGIAEASFLFRFTAIGVPGRTFADHPDAGERIYVNPTGQPDESGFIRASYISGTEAKKLTMNRGATVTQKVADQSEDVHGAPGNPD